MKHSSPQRTRHYSNVVIENQLQTAFVSFKVETISTELLCFGPSTRPPNESNVNRIKRSISSSFRNSEALLVWRTSELPMQVISGNQQLFAANLLKIRIVPCVFLVGCNEPSPTKYDLLFAHQRAILFERNNAPRSVLSRLIEVRSIMEQVERQGKHLTQFSVKDLRIFLPAHGAGGPYFSHWAQGIGDDHLRSYLRCAKVFRVACVEGYLDEIERIAYDPTKISSDVMFMISQREMERSGFARGVLQRICDELKSDSRMEIKLNDAEKAEFRHVTTNRSKITRKKESRQKDVFSKDAVKAFRRGIAYMKNGASKVEMRSLPIGKKRFFSDIRKKISRLEVLVQNFSEPVSNSSE